MKEIDIIIPIYKATQTLYECLASIACQTLVDKIRVILVQDADGKNYDHILNCFDDVLDITFISLPKNMGPGYARQKGIDIGKSPYIIFVDADDTLFSCLSIEYLYANITEMNANVLASYFLGENADKTYLEYKKPNPWVFAKIFKREFLINNNITFPNTHFNEDISFIMKSEACCDIEKDFIVIEHFTYFWKHNIASLTRYQTEERRQEIALLACKSQIDNTIDFFDWLIEKKDIVDFSEIDLEWLLGIVFKIYLDFQRCSHEEDERFLKKYHSLLKKDLKRYISHVYEPILKFISTKKLNEIYTVISYNYEKDTTLSARGVPVCSFEDFLKFIKE